MRRMELRKPHLILLLSSQVGKSSKDYTGKAQVIYPNGDQYEGYFKDGVREGYGILAYAGESGNKYEGEWLNNKKHGIGKMIFGGEGEYHGHFENGMRHGEGVFKYYKSKNIYSGKWKNGLKHGKGTYIFDETKMKIVGEWVNGQITVGKWKLSNGTNYEGIFENNFPKGSGIWHFENENSVKGEYGHELKEKDDGTEGQMIVINWKTDPELIDPSKYTESV